MANIVKILYSGLDAFAPQPTPYIGLEEQDIYVSEYWGTKEIMTLQGQITGCTFQDIITAQNNILNTFDASFQTIEIWQIQGSASGLVYSKPLSDIQSIVFSQSRMVGALDYAIQIDCYPSGLYSGAYGILEPSDTWSYEEQDNESLNAVHTISCQPFNTSSGPSNALTNARDWAFGRSGMGGMILPIFISGISTQNFCLLTQAESINRFNGTYSLVEIYTNDLTRTGYGVLRYTTDVNSGSNIITVNLQGSAQGCCQNLSGIREAYNRISWLSVANNAYESVFGLRDLNPIPLAKSFNEDPFTTRIDFAYSYDNNNQPEVWFDYTTDLSVGTNGYITASIQGIVYARGGDLTSKLIRTQAYANTVNLYNLILPYYNTFDVSSIVPLNPIPTQNGKGINQSEGTVSLNATFTNQEQVDNSLDEFNCTIEVIPSRVQVNSEPIVDGLGLYSVIVLNYASRASLSINGTAITNREYDASQGVDAVRQKCFNLFTQYGSTNIATLDRDEISQSRTDDRALSFSFSWSYGPISPIGPTSVTTIR